MNFNKIAIASMMMFGAALTHAADPVTVQGGTIHFEGELVNAACAVSTESANQTVVLGQYRTASLANVGDMTTPVPFTIKLVDCDPEVHKTASVSFAGTTIPNDTELLATSAGGTNGIAAKNVGIQISDDTSTILKVDGADKGSVKTLLSGNNVLDFTARYVATGKSTAGAANADATFFINYQ
ncbi:type 1 fimbrial major subunit FimA [Acinetobacter pullicarnis]|uniref:type 1 fimbrial major subunit FimA n=1 Tax=Acinetobacter pullicarnis TaxID=2576829 RepID=UPI00111CB43E|nr:type 1 fimbrial major subunit FimA [Acinetobacter pullicarnis]